MSKFDTIFTTDLDGTIVYSHNYEFKAEKIMVENREEYSAYMNANLYNRLHEYNNQIPFIPVTTRSVEQYNKIELPIVPEYALCLNGAILLHNGIEDVRWTEESKQLIVEQKSEFKRAIDILHGENITRTPIIINGFFVFTKSDDVRTLKEKLDAALDLTKVTVYIKKTKLYVIPKALEKGCSVERLKEKLGAKHIIAAGDSDIDESMLAFADTTIECEILKEKGEYVCLNM